METATTITSFLVDHQNDLAITVIVFLVVLALTIGLWEYHSDFWNHITNRRNRWYFCYLLLALAFIIWIIKKQLVEPIWLTFIIVLWAFLLIKCFHSLKPIDKRKKKSLFLQKYNKYLHDGLASEYIDFFKKKHPWIVRALTDKDAKIEYLILKAGYCFVVLDVEESYRSLCAIDKRDLYPEEQQYINLQKAKALMLMGNMNAAKTLLGPSDKNISLDPEVWFCYAAIAENNGDMDLAFQYAQKAKGLADVNEIGLADWELAGDYNNYARYCLFVGNKAECLQYDQLAWTKVKKSQDARLINVIGSNLVIQMSRQGCSKEECFAKFNEYKNKLVSMKSDQSILNSVELNNCEITLYRQFDEDVKAYQLIRDGYQNLISKLDFHQREIYRASTFRMLMNGLYVHDWFDKDVAIDIDHYMQLTLMERLQVFKEYFGILSQREFLALRNQEPYKSLYAMIIKYYRSSAIQEIDKELAEVESWSIYHRHNVIKYKLDILRIIEAKDHIDKSKYIYVDEYHSLYDAGLKIEAVYMLLLLMDESGSEYNVYLRTYWVYGGLLIPRWNGYGNELMDQIVDGAPVPTLENDKIHVKYPQFNLGVHDFIPTHDEVIKENIDTVIHEVDSLKNHPCKVDMSIEIAKLLCWIGRQDEAARFLDFFDESGVSERQFAQWFRNDVNVLRQDIRDAKGKTEND